MPYAASTTAGTQLKLDISSTYTNVPGVQSIQGSGAQKTKVEYTALSDTGKKFLGGIPEYGQLAIVLAWDPADTVHQAILTAAQAANSTSNIKVICSDTGAAEVAYTGGYFDAPQFGWDKDALNILTVNYVCAGAPVVTP